MSSLLPWQEIASDNISGASEICARAVHILIRRFEELDQNKTPLQEWPHWLREMLRAQPAMAPLYNLANELAFLFEQEHLKDEERIAQALAFLQKEILQSSQSNGAIARNALTLIADKPCILTHSYSSTVAAALEYAFERGVKIEVHLSEGRPANEGRGMAARLARAGMSVHFFVDDARAHFLNEAGLVLLGADRISEKGFANKIGSRSLALMAAAHKIPVAVLATRNKLWPANLPFEQEPEHASGEVWAEAAPNIVMHNFYFEETELHLAQSFITENGAFSAELMQNELRAFRAAAFWMKEY